MYKQVRGLRANGTKIFLNQGSVLSEGGIPFCVAGEDVNNFG